MIFPDTHKTFAMGDRVQKKSGSQWHGYVVGWYSTKLTPEGYAVESSSERGSVQIYPVAALELIERAEPIPLGRKRDTTFLSPRQVFEAMSGPPSYRNCNECINPRVDTLEVLFCFACEPTPRGGSLFLKKTR